MFKEYPNKQLCPECGKHGVVKRQYDNEIVKTCKFCNYRKINYTKIIQLTSN